MEVNDPAVAYQKKHLTIVEYLTLENGDIEKHEYYRGEIFAMSGAKVAHNMNSRNLLTILTIKLRGKECQPSGSDQRFISKKTRCLLTLISPLRVVRSKHWMMTTGIF